MILLDFAKRAVVSTCLNIDKIAISLLRFCKIYYVLILYDFVKRAVFSTTPKENIYHRFFVTCDD